MPWPVGQPAGCSFRMQHPMPARCDAGLKFVSPLLPSLLDIRNYWSLFLLPICQTHSWVDSNRFVSLTPVVGCQRRHDKSTTRHGRRLVVPLSPCVSCLNRPNACMHLPREILHDALRPSSAYSSEGIRSRVAPLPPIHLRSIHDRRIRSARMMASPFSATND